MTEPKALSVAHARQLAVDLVRELGELAGDPAAVDKALVRWFGVLDGMNLARVCVAAVQLTFAECLIPTPTSELPADGRVLSAPEDRKSA